MVFDPAALNLSKLVRFTRVVRWLRKASALDEAALKMHGPLESEALSRVRHILLPRDLNISALYDF